MSSEPTESAAGEGEPNGGQPNEGQPTPGKNPAVDAQAAARAGCEHAGLDAVWSREIARLVEREDDDWRSCCLSGCDPCVLQLGRAVDAARRIASGD